MLQIRFHVKTRIKPRLTHTFIFQVYKILCIWTDFHSSGSYPKIVLDPCSNKSLKSCSNKTKLTVSLSTQITYFSELF